MTRAFMGQFGDWDRVGPRGSALRTAKVLNANYTPYEVVLGLKPCLLVNSTLGVPSFVQKLPVERY
eukprot:12023025-Alexandrium_andersonii.AAC.1